MAQRQRKGTQEGTGLRGLYIGLGAVAVVGVAAIAWSLSSVGGDAATEVVDLTGISPEELMAQATPITAGPADAPVEVRVFSDYTCPGCAHFSRAVKPMVMGFADQGIVRLMYYDFPLGGPSHPHSVISARAARCAADQDRFWDFQDMLFGRQSVWSLRPASPVDAFIGYAEELGMDADAFASCLRSDAHAQVVSANRALSEQLGLGSTPTVFVGTRSMAGTSWGEPEAVRQAILQASGGAAGAGSATGAAPADTTAGS